MAIRWGYYEIGAVASGAYILRVDPTLAQGYPRTNYTDTYNQTDAQRITITAGAQTGGIDFVLPQAGWIEGSVANQLSQPLADIDLDLFDTTPQAFALSPDSRLDKTAPCNLNPKC